jgi:predicted unusual protein kinase regulating ubiquinone biosynthesis (AarF/ABC1/UbiB family)
MPAGIMDAQRTLEIERAVDRGLRDREVAAAKAGAPQTHEYDRDVLASMPTRRLAHQFKASHVALPMVRKVEFKAGIVLTCSRMLRWLRLALFFHFGSALDVALGRASVERRAIRFRQLIERAGGSFIKVGQQLSVRADLLPHAFCVELSKLLDRVPAMPHQDAVTIIERGIGKPLEEVFASLDPKPIGSASLACVYQAVLKTGERVAVKVRRPDIGRLIAADLRALDWLMILSEVLTFVHPGSTVVLRRELRNMLMAELNFRNEARSNEIFRLQAEKDNEGITAPRVFFDYCSEEVLVNELVSGVWMWEFMSAIDQNDRQFLDQLREIGIEPATVARRMLRALHRELLEHLFFHADPHPANLVVLAGGRICFVDFGAIGRLSTESRIAWRELQFHMINQDIERMVRTSLKFAGRLPPINIDDAMAALEQIYADWMYAVSSSDAQWWERSSAQTWLRYISTARQFGIPVNRETIQFFRATFLYDTIIARLDKSIDPFQEWKGYARRAGKEARERARQFMKKRANGPTPTDYLRLEQIVDTINQAMFRLQSTIDDPVLRFKETAGKISYAVSTFMKLGYFLGVVACLVLAVEFVAETFFGTKIAWWQMARELFATSPLFKLVLVIVSLVFIRRLLIRTNQPDTRPK